MLSDSFLTKRFQLKKHTTTNSLEIIHGSSIRQAPLHTTYHYSKGSYHQTLNNLKKKLKSENSNLNLQQNAKIQLLKCHLQIRLMFQPKQSYSKKARFEHYSLNLMHLPLNDSCTLMINIFVFFFHSHEYFYILPIQ